MEKLKAGLVLLSAKWFLDVGIQDSDSGRNAGLSEMIGKDVESIIAAAGKHFEIIFPGVIHSSGSAEKAADKFRIENADVVIIVHMMWCEDAPLISILKNLDLPVILWGYNPYTLLPGRMKPFEMLRASGSVGILQGSGPMKKMGVKFSYVFGTPGDTVLDRQLGDLADVYKAWAGIKMLRIGQIGPRCEPMTGNYLDEFRLMTKLGPVIVPVSAYRLYEISMQISDREVNELAGTLKSTYKVNQVSDLSLFYAAKATLAVEKVIEEENLGAVAIEDLNIDLHKLFKTRPCLWTDSLSRKKVVVGMEADVMNTMGMWINRQLGGSAPMFTEIYTFDQQMNSILMGHPGMHDPSLAGDNPVTIVPDYEYESSDEVEGAWMHFAAKPGPVTVSSMFADEQNYRMFVFNGEVLPVKDKLEGYLSAFVKIGTPLRDFYEKAIHTGMTQHFAISYDDIGTKLKKFCEISGIEFVSLP